MHVSFLAKMCTFNSDVTWGASGQECLWAVDHLPRTFSGKGRLTLIIENELQLISTHFWIFLQIIESLSLLLLPDMDCTDCTDCTSWSEIVPHSSPRKILGTSRFLVLVPCSHAQIWIDCSPAAKGESEIWRAFRMCWFPYVSIYANGTLSFLYFSMTLLCFICAGLMQCLSLHTLHTSWKLHPIPLDFQR